MSHGKPDFFIIRHAESAGNVDTSVYLHTPDHKVPLTDKGISQAQEAKKKLEELLSKKSYASIYTWVSPYTRTKQTYEHMYPHHIKTQVRYDPRIREQEWGSINNTHDRDKFVAERKKVGHFFYRFPNGESGADVYDRVSHFLESVFRNPTFVGPPQANVVFTHGLTGRILAQRLMHVDYEEFERWDNLKNCQILYLSRKPGGYQFVDGYGVSKWK